MKRTDIAHTETGIAHGRNWMNWLGHLAGRPFISGLEIGTFKGASAEWFLDNILTDPTSTMTCIDHFRGGPDQLSAGIDCSELERLAMDRLRRFSPRVYFLTADSNRALRGLPSVPGFDFIYVDGSHDGLNTLRDSVLAWEVLKTGGVMIWDDYGWKERHDCPKPAIDAFLRFYFRELIFLQAKGGDSWQMTARKV